MVVHTGTHVDAPLHFCADGPGMDAIPLERLMGPGVVIRLELSACEEITAQHLETATPAIEPGDIVARIRWLEREVKRRALESATAPRHFDPDRDGEGDA